MVHSNGMACSFQRAVKTSMASINIFTLVKLAHCSAPRLKMLNRGPTIIEPKRTLSPNLTSRHPVSALLILFQRKRLANYTTGTVRGVVSRTLASASAQPVAGAIYLLVVPWSFYEGTRHLHAFAVEVVIVCGPDAERRGFHLRQVGR